MGPGPLATLVTMGALDFGRPHDASVSGKSELIQYCEAFLEARGIRSNSPNCRFACP